MHAVGAFLFGKPNFFITFFQSSFDFPIFLDSFFGKRFLLFLIKASTVFLDSLYSISSTRNLDFF